MTLPTAPPTILTLLPERLRDAVARAAAAAATTPEAWVERAVARQLDDAVWRDVLAYGEARALALGYTEDDGERPVADSRRDSRDQQPTG